MSNLKLWNEVRKVPNEAKKEIIGGRMKGMTDINPVWRMKVLTEQFGPVGFGWKYEILEERLQTGANGEIAAFVRINLYVLNGDMGWSEPIPGTGGNMFVASEKSGLRTSDECFKMALTDAISVACKALGIGADVYWNKDKTKYEAEKTDEAEPLPNDAITENQAKRLFAIAKGNNEGAKRVMLEYGYTSSKYIKKQHYEEISKKIEELGA